jgi:hypothetical protein
MAIRSGEEAAQGSTHWGGETAGLLSAGLAQLVYGLGDTGDRLYLLCCYKPACCQTSTWIGGSPRSTAWCAPARRSSSRGLSPFFAIGRLLASWRVLRNRLWGFWLSIFTSAATVFWAVFFLPLGGIDLLACLFIVSALFAGRLGRESIAPSEKG